MTDQTRPSCSRCRLDLIRFTREVVLPRFTMRPGDEWDMPQSRYTPDGRAELGAGHVPADAFVVVTPFASRACGCACSSVV